ncbi:MAG: DUF4167 domain-containing protein [Alphaproteobacteria bacterium]
MRHGTSSRRQRSRNNSRRSNQPRAQVYDSNGPDVRIRGTAHQVAEKYLALAKDAHSAGDSIVAENYFQHAEHYIRIINENNGKFDASKILGKSSANGNVGQADPATQNERKPSVRAKREDQDLALPKSIVAAPAEKVRSEDTEAVG